MQKKLGEANIVLALSLVGIFGAIITIISDLILLGKPSNGYLFFQLGTETMADLAPWRITWGTFLGVVALPFQTFGLVPLYVGLKPSGRVLPIIVVVMNAHALLMGVAFHMQYAFIGSGWRLHYNADPGNTITSEMVSKFDSYWKILIIIMLIEILLSSSIYVWILLKRNTLFPKWMAALNPLCIVFFILPIIIIIPAPAGGYIAPAILNLSTIVFIILSMTIVTKKLRIKN